MEQITVMVFREGTRFTYAAIVAGQTAIGGIAGTKEEAVMKALVNYGAVKVVDVMQEYDAAQSKPRPDASVTDGEEGL